MTTIRRRDLLKAGGAGILTLSLPLPAGYLRRAFAGEDGMPTLVVLYLRGGMDALNAVVPYGDKGYYAMRPTLAVPPVAIEETPGVFPLDREFGLHPALSALKPFWDQNKLAPVVAVGSPHPTRSHFDAQDFMEYAAPGMRTVRDGWLNRYLRLSGGSEERRIRALAMQGLLPRALRGKVSVLAVPDKSVLENEEMLEMFGTLYADDGMATRRPGEKDEVVETGRFTVATLKRFREILQRKDARSGAKYPGGALAARLRSIAQVIRTDQGLEIAALDVNGWDTHAGQGQTTGTMPRLMKNLADSLAAFMTDLGPHLDRTLILTMTEFGRTCRENGNYGTDHGHGGLMLLMGGGVKGGKVHGKWTGLKEKDLYQNRDLQVTTDFRDVLAEVLTNHFRFKVKKGFFPDYKPSRIRGLFA